MSRQRTAAIAFCLLLFLAQAGCGAAPAERSAVAGVDSAPVTAAAADSLAPRLPATTFAADPAASAPSVARAPRVPSFETVLEPIHDVEVFARLDGEVVGLRVEEGHRVALGATLANLDDRSLAALLAEREAEVARSESAWGRAQKLQAEKVISEEQWIAARSEWEIAKARRDQARIEHEWCTVKAPIAGVVALRRIQRGQLVKKGDLMFRVSDPDRLRAELLLPESYLGRVRAGQRAHLSTAGGRTLEAPVTRVSPLVDPASGTFRVVIDVDNRRARLPSGVAVHVDLGLAAAARE